MIATASPLCGIANLPNQRHKIAIKKGINYTILVVGQSGAGKTTFINTLLATSISKGEDYSKRHRSTDKTTHITLTKAVIEENLFKVKLTIVDTPGFGDYINNNETWVPIIDFIDTQYQSYFYQEQQPDRNLLNDVRVNVCLYFISPSSHGLSSLDIQAMKQIGSRCNLIPIIAKADTFSPRDLQEYKDRIRQTLQINQIQVYSPAVDHNDPIDSKIGSEILDAMPFSVIGSEDNVKLSDGTQVRGRQYPWGVVQVENDEHCDFRKLRNLLIRTHMLELINSTDEFHYDKFKTSYLEQGGADKNKKENPKFKEEEEALRRKFTEQVRIEEARFRQWELKLIAERDRLNRDLEVEHVVVRQLESEIESLQASQLQTKNTYRN